MTRHHIARSDEAFWSGHKRAWAHIQQSAPRTALAAHLRAGVLGAIVALAIVLVETVR